MDAVIIGAVCGGAVVVLLVVWTIASSVRRKKAAEEMLAADPYLPLVFTQVGPAMQSALREAVGGVQIQVVSVDGKAAPVMLTAEGRFTPVTPGSHQFKLQAVQQIPGLARRIITGELSLELARGQRVLLDVDLNTSQWIVRGL